MQQILSTGQVARMLGIQTYQIEYAITSRQLPEPGFRFLGKRAFTADDVRQVAAHFSVSLGDEFKVGEEAKVGQ